MREHKSLEEKAKHIRKTILKMVHNAGSGHLGGSLSAVEIILFLYEYILNVNPDNPADDNRDRFVLSKGHAAPLLYAVLAEYGFFPKEELMTLRKLGSRLQGHPCSLRLLGVDLSTGSLGLGLSAATGMALAAKLKRSDYHVYVLCGDGELNEGQNWEAMMAIHKWNLKNLTVIIDRNHVQLDGTEDEIMPMKNLEEKVTSFGLHVISCNGHSFSELNQALKEAGEFDGPVAIIAETVKGKGVSFMEGNHKWHGRRIDDNEYVAAIKEVGGI